MDVILFTAIKDRGFSRNYGAYLVAAAVREAGYTCQVIDFFDELTLENIQEIADKFVDDETKYIAFSSTFFAIRRAFLKDKFVVDDYFPQTKKFMKQFFDIFRRASSTIKFVYGGLLTLTTNRDHPDIDYWVTGPGEKVMVNLLKASKISSKIYDNVIDGTFDPETFRNKESVTWDKSDHLFQGENLPLETSKGCPFHCIFCNRPKYEYPMEKNIDILRDELIRNYELFGTTKYFLIDDLLITHNKRMIEMFDLFTSLPFKIRYSCFGKVSGFDKHPEWRDMMIESGCYNVEFGLETLKAKTMKAINKTPSPERQLEILYWLREKWENKIQMSASIIAGLPYENEAEILETVRFLDSGKSPLDQVVCIPLSISVNKNIGCSALELNPKKFGYNLISPGHRGKYYRGFPGEWESLTSDMTSKKAVDLVYDYFSDDYSFRPFFVFIARIYNLGFSLDDVIWNDDFLITKENREAWDKIKTKMKDEYLGKLL